MEEKEKITRELEEIKKENPSFYKGIKKLIKNKKKNRNSKNQSRMMPKN